MWNHGNDIWALFAIMVITMLSCGPGPAEKEEFKREQVTTATQALNDGVTEREEGEPGDHLQEPLLNQRDSLGRKQGLWVTELEGRPWKEEHYSHGELHGTCTEYFADGTLLTTTYERGVKHGLSFRYWRDSTYAEHQALYDQGEFVYGVWPWELATYIVPVKGWRTERDSLEFHVQYRNGQPLYHGFLRALEGTSLLDPAYGVHRAYYEDGMLKAIIDYDNDSIILFNRSGQVLETMRPREWHGRQLR